MYISGMGCISSAGSGVEAFRATMRQPTEAAPAHMFKGYKGIEDTLFFQGSIQEPIALSALSLAEKACLEALSEYRTISVNETDIAPTLKVALVLASGAGETNEVTNNSNTASPYALAQQLTERLGIDGVYLTVSNACSSSGYALSIAEDLIANHDVVLLCGVEAKSSVSQAAFKSLLILDDTSCRPFSDDRSGTVFGCGACAILLTSKPQRTRTPEIKIKATSLSCDAFHATSPRPDGLEIRRCINQVLEETGISAQDIGVIIPHGTGTKLNDNIESAILSELFGKPFQPKQSLLVKSFIGHTGGASTAFSVLAAVMELINNRKAIQLSHALVLSTSFGGHNSATIICLGSDVGRCI